MAEKYTVDSGVPIPGDRFDPVPIEDLEVGQSIAVTLDKRNAVQSKASRVKRRTGRDFKIKKVDADTVRVWRVS